MKQKVEFIHGFWFLIVNKLVNALNVNVVIQAKIQECFFEKLFCENLNILENKNGRRNCLERVSLAINGQR